MKATCCSCVHYEERSYLYTTGGRNVSGGVAWRRGWSKHRCNLKQEYRYPNSCDYEMLEKYKEEKERLALEMKRIFSGRNTFSGLPEPTKMAEAARWHNQDCAKLNDGKCCTCACGWAKIGGRYSCSWWKFIKIYGWRKAIKAQVL